LGTVARQAAEAGYEVILVSADKDLMQLVGPHVSMFHTGREKLYTPELVEQDFGVPPRQVIDVLALMGDSVDNVPGVPGIGEKGAKNLIAEYGSVENLLDKASEIKRKSYREGLQEHRDLALLSKKLVTIHTDVDVPFEADQLRLEEPDNEALREIFSRLEFFSLLEELTTSHETEATDPAVEIVESAEAIRVLADAPKELCLWLLQTGGATVGLGVRDGDGGARWVDFRRSGMETAMRESLSARVAEADGTFIGHDLKEVLRWLGPEVSVKARLRDLMLYAYLDNPALKGFSLAEMALEALRYRPVSLDEAGFRKGEMPALGDPALLTVVGERLDLIDRLLPILEERMKTGRLAEVYEEIEEPLVPVLMRMEEAGIGLDTEFLDAMSTELATAIGGLEEEIVELAGEPFNLNSPRQLGEILFDKLGYPILKRTRKTKSYSTDADTLQVLASRGYPLPGKVLEYRELAKLKSTYVDAFPQLVAADGRLHTRYYQAVAATGRLSSADPNLQNIPVRTEEGKKIRRAFVAAPGHQLLVADYSQIELRVLAHIAGEERMIDAFLNHRDIHATTAANVFGIDPALVSPDQRRAAKVINFGIVYGMSPFGLAKTLEITSKEAKAFIEAYMDRYPGVRRYTEETLANAAETLQVETLYGRVRRLPELASRQYQVRENAKRMAINARIQGTAADLLKIGMIAVDRRLRDEQPRAQLLLTVHDELVVEVPREDVAAVTEIVVTEMEGVAQLAVPLVVESGVGASWYEAKGGGD
ncbi:MAG: DNA polymerase I, partial [Thermoanaerobaculia bacterium]|nr:DNA polymerase I [Thermoanaerobaculia bacterium]